MKMPERITLELPGLENLYAKVLSQEEARDIADGITGRWGVGPRNPYANQNHRKDCGCHTCFERRKKWESVATLIVMMDDAKYYKHLRDAWAALDAIATLLGSRP